MRPRSLLILFLVAASLAAFIWFYERQLPSSEERRELANRVLRLEADEITEVTLEIGDRRVRLERAADPASAAGDEVQVDDAVRRWRLLEPFAEAADQAAVEDLLATLTALESKRKLTDLSGAEAGIEPPRARVTLAALDERHELLLGSEIPASSSLIVGVGGTGVLHVVGDELWADLDREPGDWRSREVFPGQRSDIERLTITAGADRLLLARRGQSFWVESPFVDRADQEASEELLSELAEMRIELFLDELPSAPADLGLEPPRGAVEVVLADRAQPFRVELGAPAPASEGRFFARVGDQVFETDSGVADALDRSLDSWRSRSWSSLESYEIDRAAIRGDWGEVELAREGPDWLRDGVEIPFGPASELLYAIGGVEADRVVASELARLPGEPAVVEIDLVSEGAEESLRLYTPQDGVWPATVDSREVILHLPGRSVEELRDRLEEVLAAEAVVVDESSVDEPPPSG